MTSLTIEKKLQYKAEAYLILVALMWGVSFPVVKIALIYSSPFIFVFFRFLITSLIFLIFFHKDLHYANFIDYKYGVIIGIALFFGYTTQTIGLKYSSASNTAFITGTNIVFIPFLQMLLVKTKPGKENIIGIFIVLIGLYLLTEIKSNYLNIGDLFTLFCAISFGFYIVFLDKYTKKYNLSGLIAGQFISTTILALLASLFFEGIIFKDFKLEFTQDFIISLIITALFSTFLGLYFSIKYQRFTTPVRAGLLYNMEQIFAVIFAYFIISEVLNTKQIIGAGVMLIGTVISEFYTPIINFIRNEKS